MSQLKVYKLTVKSEPVAATQAQQHFRSSEIAKQVKGVCTNCCKAKSRRRIDRKFQDLYFRFCKTTFSKIVYESCTTCNYFAQAPPYSFTSGILSKTFTAQHFAPCTNDGSTYLISESCMATNYPYQVTTVRTIIIIIIINPKDHAILCDIGAQQQLRYKCNHFQPLRVLRVAGQRRKPSAVPR